MAEVSFTQVRSHGKVKVKWEGITDGDTGAPFTPPDGYTEGAVQVSGTFGGSTLTMQGSLDDGANYASLGITFTSAGIEGLVNPVENIRPSESSGTGVDLDVTLILVPG